jgi:hypothetical protein
MGNIINKQRSGTSEYTLARKKKNTKKLSPYWAVLKGLKKRGRKYGSSFP